MGGFEDWVLETSTEHLLLGVGKRGHMISERQERDELQSPAQGRLQCGCAKNQQYGQRLTPSWRLLIPRFALGFRPCRKGPSANVACPDLCTYQPGREWSWLSRTVADYQKEGKQRAQVASRRTCAMAWKICLPEPLHRERGPVTSRDQQLSSAAATGYSQEPQCGAAPCVPWP